MSWLSPQGLYALGLAVPLIALYVLKIRRARRTVSSTWLWAAARRDLLAESPWQRLRPYVPLLLQLAALACLGLALGRPAARTATLGGDHVAIVLDVSASMAAVEPDGTRRIDRARAEAGRLLAGLPPGASALLVEAGRDARALTGLDRDRVRLLRALDGVTPEESEGRLGPAVALAAERLASARGDRRVVVVTDAAVADPGAVQNVAVPVSVVQVGGPLDNTAITRVDVRAGSRPGGRDQQVQAFALVAHFGKARREVFLTLRMTGVKEPLASRKLTLEPGEKAPVVLSFDAAPVDAGAGLTFELSPPDALTVDDRAFARVPPSRKLPVVVSPRGASPWVERALLADSDVELAGAPVESLATASVPGDALVVLVGVCPERVPGMDLLIVAPPAGPCRTVTLGPSIARPVVTTWDEADPRLRFLTFDGVDIVEARKLEGAPPRSVLVRAGDAPLIVDVSSPGRTGTLIAFEPGDSTWPLKASFVLFVRNVLELARAHRAEGLIPSARTGDTVRARVPWDVTEVTLVEPGGEEAVRPTRDGQAVLPSLRKAGLYHLSWQGGTPGSTRFAANLASETESRLDPLPLAPGTLGAAGTEAAATGLVDLSWVLAAVALAFLALDAWWLGRRAPPPRLGTPPRPDRGAARRPA